MMSEAESMGRAIASLSEVTGEKWVSLFVDLIVAGWTVEEIAEGYGFLRPELARTESNTSIGDAK
jgi:hypothetical protein